jgi:serine/threonine protein kinase
VEQGYSNHNSPQSSQKPGATETGKRICPNCGLKLSTDITICPNDGTVLVQNAEVDQKLSNQYEFISEIGSGGMGVIYKARHIALNQTVAIKMLHNNRMDEVSVRRFQQEAKAVTALDHPSIVRVRDFGVSDSGQPHMVLDFIEGDTLSKSIQKTAGLSVEESLDIFIQACDALEHAHIRGVLHRDLKPSNIMLVPRISGAPLVKIVDFGIAKINIPEIESGVVNLTQTGEVFGSPLYMSPEQASGARLDKRSDIYSFGCVMFETLTGTPPFVGGSSIETIFRQLNDKAPSLKEGSLGRDFPGELESIVAKTLEKKPENRFQSMAELKNQLIAVKTGKTSSPAFQPNDSMAGESKKFELKALIAALVVLVFLAAGTGYFVITSSAKKEKAAAPEVVDDQTKAKQIITQNLNSAEVDLANLKVTDKMLELFAEPTKTTAVNLSGTSVIGPGLANLIHLPLQSLNLAGSALTDRGLEDICHMEDLQKLDLRKTSISDEGMSDLRPLTNLQELDVSDDAVGKRTCSMQKYWPKLTVLKMNNTHIGSDDAFGDLARSKSLQTLSLNDAGLRNIDLDALARGHVQNLSIDGAAIDDAGLQRIPDMKSLKALSMKRCHLTPEAITRLKSERPDLNIITE